MKMSSKFLASPGGRLTQRVSLGICILAAAALVACGGGGSGTETAVVTPAVTTPNVTAQSCKVAVTSVTIGNFNAVGAQATPVAVNAAFTGDYVITGSGCGEGSPKVAVSATFSSCPGALPGQVVIAPTTQTTGTFTVTHANFGYNLTCGWEVTPSVNGTLGDTKVGTFKTEQETVSVPAHGEMVLAINTGRTDFSLPLVLVNPVTGGVQVAINKTGYTSGTDPLRLCGALVINDAASKEFVAWTTTDGYAVAECQARYETVSGVVTPTRYKFLLNPVTGELGAKYTGAVPANVKVVDVTEGHGVTSYPNIVDDAKGGSVAVGAKVFFKQPASGLGLSVTTNNFANHSLVDGGDLKVIIKIPTKN